MIKPTDPADANRAIAHILLPTATFNALVNALHDMPFRVSAPILAELTANARAVFQDQLARIVDMPDDSDKPLETPTH